MSKVYFMNDGEFDVSSMLTFGVSVKEEGSIGYFGTGFKYAIAIILKLGGSIKVKTKDNEFVFDVIRKNIRGKDFSIVTCNGVESGFTTHLGAKWQPWQAFRELYSNCSDENGETSNMPDNDRDTIIEVDCDLIYDAYVNKDDYFISGKPVYKTDRVEYYEGGRPYYYFKGVAVASCDESVYSYNILSTVDLTEDRTAQYSGIDIMSPIIMGIQNCKNEHFIKKVLVSEKEGDQNRGYDGNYTTSDQFVSCCRKAIAANRSIPESARLAIKKMDEKAGDWPEIDLSPVQIKMLDKAKRFLFSIDIKVDDFPIRTVVGLGDGVMGRALDEVIYLSEIPFDQGTKQVASTLMEEWVHIKFGCADFDRQMQSWLFDKILSISEGVFGEPL